MTSETLRSLARPDRPVAAPPISYADTAASTRSQVRRRALPGGRTTIILLGTAAALAGTALIVNWQARRAERRHPPEGEFITVNGVRLHYTEAGEGSPVILLHGNGTMLNDVALGILGPLAKTHRVIAFDRPGFGYSERPRDRVWTPEEQAALLRDALRALGVDRPVLYGHSFGAPVVVTFALMYPEETRGVVAASGYYYPTRRLDSLFAWSNVLPVLGPVLRNTLVPVEGAVFGKLAVKALFDPAEIPPTYDEFPSSLALRPGQLRAAGEDGTTLRAWAKRISPHYGEISVPVMIVSGAEDRAVSYRTHSLRLGRQIPGARLHIWPETGHMVHHTRATEVIDAIEEVFEIANQRTPTESAPAAEAFASSETERAPHRGTP
jgi:pimeloyl-ACP methyl ester carboxylesterase